MAKTILEEASLITSGERRRAYGHPKDNHGNTAEFWKAYLKRKYGINVPLDTRDVCIMMILLKVSRDANKQDRDNLVDICGYARNAEMAEELTDGSETKDQESTYPTSITIRK